MAFSKKNKISHCPRPSIKKMSGLQFVVIEQNDTNNTIRFPPMAAHFDIFSDENIILFPGEERIVNSNISIIECPEDIICEIKSIKDMVIKKRLYIQDYIMDIKGSVKIKIINNNPNDNGNTVNIRKGDKIAVLSFANSRKFV